MMKDRPTARAMLRRIPAKSVVTSYLAQHDRALVAYAGFAAFMT